MSKLSALIRELAPGGVPHRPLGELIEKNIGGGTPSRARDDYWGGAIPWASVGDLTSPGLTLTTTRGSITPKGLASSSTSLVPQGSVLVAIKIAPGRMKVAESEVAINQDIRGLTLLPELDARFLTYYFRKLRVIGNGTIVKAITSATLEKIAVPVPPIEVQREIVRILDHFTELEAELEAELDAELDARRRQYDYHRHSLLDFGLEVPRSLLGDFASVRTGQAPRAEELSDDGRYRFVNAGLTESGHCRAFNTSADTVTIPSRGQGGVGIVGYQSEDFWCGPLCYRIKSESPEVRTRYLFHYLKSVQSSIRALQQEGGTPALNRKELVTVEVPLPPIEQQVKIVEVLDKFDALVNDLSIGLPAELAARRKQYEYYRDKLLTFEEAPA